MMQTTKELMIPKPISITPSLWNKALARAKNNGQSLSYIIRRLLERWLAGEIGLH